LFYYFGQAKISSSEFRVTRGGKMKVNPNSSIFMITVIAQSDSVLSQRAAGVL
jgi:hypothetical protein